MPNGEVNIRLELGIDARKIMQVVQLDNAQIEEQISKGVQQALEEITSSDNLVAQIKAATIKQFSDIISTAVMSWEMKQRIQKLVDEKIGKKLNEYAEQIAEKVTENLNKVG